MGIVLVVEDDSAVQSVIRAVLAKNGFAFELAGGAQEAFELCRRCRDSIDLLIADVQIPCGSGTDVAVEMSRCRPQAPILFTSGTDIDFWSEADRANVASLPQGSFAFLPKPFTCWALMQKIDGLLFRLPRYFAPSMAGTSSGRCWGGVTGIR